MSVDRKHVTTAERACAAAAPAFVRKMSYRTPLVPPMEWRTLFASAAAVAAGLACGRIPRAEHQLPRQHQRCCVPSAAVELTGKISDFRRSAAPLAKLTSGYEGRSVRIWRAPKDRVLPQSPSPTRVSLVWNVETCLRKLAVHASRHGVVVVRTQDADAPLGQVSLSSQQALRSSGDAPADHRRLAVRKDGAASRFRRIGGARKGRERDRLGKAGGGRGAGALGPSGSVGRSVEPVPQSTRIACG